ncbi:transferase 2, rSAM/selenodomain-associated [Enhydrobacter aerosaccus]|uniref:Transferase 2, rSAM/selenodomain-associated n=1 Tax=Enhydrobacter aerosaccus TaxID=225324 RepID=A0A1T4SAU6_9HYPH|nr:TIGR04283 family arsenosugar biosynthesis glycosyltransferase [Enhydrobacter aerosaccus]SKA24971.1 transferase 2, rSAM/selenodomain-associated [Enhydrobacter aerosaccus]
MSLSVVIPTLNAADRLRGTLQALGVVDDLVVVDGASTDDTIEVAKAFAARVVAAPAGRGHQLMAGAAVARGPWLLFLHADTQLAPGWRAEVDKFVAEPCNSARAAVFRFALDDRSWQARLLEKAVSWRVRIFGLPYGDQGLLIRRDFYRSLGGFPAWPLMEDVHLVRRIGRNRLTILPAAAHTSAERWRRGGWIRRTLRNFACLSLYFLGVPPRLIFKVYD